MSKIDLSMAKVGDKFRTKDGQILEYLGENLEYRDDIYELKDEQGLVIEQVFDVPLDELIEEGTKQIKESRDAIKEENELQRRQEVVELAERIFTKCENTTIEDAFCGAETFIKFKNKYLKDGKLC